MVKQLWSVAALAAAVMFGFAGSARADEAPVPPQVEGAPVATGGGYCYAGPHPVDTRVAAGGPWDETPTPHTHLYPPFDLRLFTLKDGCYHFVGDPRDFGYQGQTYAYYGAHPVHDYYGGGWCFMIGGHAHGWRPWSPYFVVAGPWFYWSGVYDPFFWDYWPYYAHYYGHYYPRYYGSGRFWRGHSYRAGRRGDWAAAPPIGRVPRGAPAAAGAPPAGMAGMGGTGMPAPGGGMAATPRPAVVPGRAVPRNGTWTQGNGWSGGNTWGGSYSRPQSPPPVMAPSVRSGGSYFAPSAPAYGTYRAPPSSSVSGGSYRQSAPAAPVRAAPSAGGARGTFRR